MWFEPCLQQGPLVLGGPFRVEDDADEVLKCEGNESKDAHAVLLRKSLSFVSFILLLVI